MPPTVRPWILRHSSTSSCGTSACAATSTRTATAISCSCSAAISTLLPSRATSTIQLSGKARRCSRSRSEARSNASPTSAWWTLFADITPRRAGSAGGITGCWRFRRIADFESTTCMRRCPWRRSASLRTSIEKPGRDLNLRITLRSGCSSIFDPSAHQHRAADLLRLADSAEWDDALDLRALGFIQESVPDHVRVHPARGDAVHPDAEARELRGEGFGEADDRSFGRGVVTVLGFASLPRGGRDQDDLSAFALPHLRGGVAAQRDRAFQVDVGHLVPFRFGDPVDRRAFPDAVADDEDVGRAELLRALLDHLLRGGPAGEIRAQLNGPSSAARNGLDHLARGPLIVLISNSHGSARLAEKQRGGAADSTRCPTHQGGSTDQRNADHARKLLTPLAHSPPMDRIEQELESPFRLRPVLDAEAEQHELSLAVGQRHRRRVSHQFFRAVDPTREQHVLRVLWIPGEHGAPHLFAWKRRLIGDRLVDESRRFHWHSIGHRMVGIDLDAQKRARTGKGLGFGFGEDVSNRDVELVDQKLTGLGERDQRAAIVDEVLQVFRSLFADAVRVLRGKLGKVFHRIFFALR